MSIEVTEASNPETGAETQSAQPEIAVVGRVGAPVGHEATSSQFFFWSKENATVEKTQLVRVESTTGDKPFRVYGLVTEVFRRSRLHSMLEESDRFDARPEEQVPLDSRGVTYAKVRVLATRPNVFAPPLEDSMVWPAVEADSRIAYSIDEMAEPLVVGLIKDGGDRVIGPACVDLAYVLGALGGHINVTGIAGAGTKSSFLTIVLRQLLSHFEMRGRNEPGNPDSPRAKAVIINVKGFDLFHLSRYSNGFTESDLTQWQAMGWAEPRPMECEYFAPQDPATDRAIETGSPLTVRPYSWTLGDLLLAGLFEYLFSDGERVDDNFQLLIHDIERILIQESRDAVNRINRRQNPGAPQTFAELFDWFRQGLEDEHQGNDHDWNWLTSRQHHPATLRRFFRRLRRGVNESGGIFRMDGGGSHPLDLNAFPDGMPCVVDIASLSDRHLQRFVVAALFKQAKDEATGGRAQRGMHYLFLLDELNRFAPRGHSDPITQLVEEVAAELRSRGIILLGAQQQASLVSTRVVENASVRVIGRTGGYELGQSIFSFLPGELKDYVEKQGPADKVLYEPSFREPMMVRVPRAPWAMRGPEATDDPVQCLRLQGADEIVRGPRILPPSDEVP
ncbi:MAG: ATP-binding protein [Actinobacteria bacterium]|nr:ATP-binding protein [Actinomycetota bacterium]